MFNKNNFKNERNVNDEDNSSSQSSNIENI